MAIKEQKPKGRQGDVGDVNVVNVVPLCQGVCIVPRGGGLKPFETLARLNKRGNLEVLRKPDESYTLLKGDNPFLELERMNIPPWYLAKLKIAKDLIM